MKRERHPQWVQATEQARADFGKPNFLPWLTGIQSTIHPGSAHRYLQLLELDGWCLANRPNVILELGSGYSTLVIARYACEFRNIRHVAVEESAEYRDWVIQNMPEWGKVQWHLSPVVTDETGGTMTRRYESLPDLSEVDLLYVDGPNCDYMGKSLAGSDAVKLAESGVRPKHVLFDRRNDSVDLFREVEGYGFEAGGSYETNKPLYLRPLRHHSWFWRK
jgi:hypothetical protein